jgi:predicted DNA-binding transcriptional regulator AlpA
MENNEMAVRIIDKDGLKARGIDLNDATIWRKEKSGKFPKHIMVGNRRAWVETEIDAFLENLIAARDVVAA